MDLEPKDQNRIFDQIWNPIEENARDLIRQKSLVSDYIRDYLTLRNKKIPNKSKVYYEFKKLYQDKKEESYYDELENIKSLSVHYKKLVNPSIVLDPDLRRELEFITRLEINVAFPFLLQVFEDAENGVIGIPEVIAILKLIQSYAWRRFIVGLPTNALNKIFMTLYSEVDIEEYVDSVAVALIKKRGSAKFPTNDELETALKDKDLYNTQAKNRNYMFEMLENFNNREFVNTSNENITIEHIFPRNPNSDWSEKMLADEYFIFKEKRLNTIANLTLSGNNGALSNKSFIDKKEMNIDGGEQGYRFSRLWLNSYLNTIDNWNASNYENRLEIIVKRFFSIWEYPNVKLPEVEDVVEQNIFDAEKPRYKKLEYFIFENTKIEEEAVAQMYFYVVKKLYQRNTPLLLNNSQIVKLSHNADDFRGPHELISGYYIEANIDNDTKFRNLKQLLEIFELEDELLIKYDSNWDFQTETPNRFLVRRQYWKQLLPLLKDTDLFSNVNASKDHWLSAGAGLSGLAYTFLITRKYIRIELGITTSDKQRNKNYFHSLFSEREMIENRFNDSLIWEELPDNKMSRIKYELQGLNIFDPVDWENMNNFLVTNLPKFEDALKPSIMKLK